MTFDYGQVIDDLKAALPAAEITYQHCTSDGRTFFVGKRTAYFLITARIQEPTFREDLVCIMVVDKSALRGHRIVPLLKRGIEDAYNAAIEKRIATGKALRATLICT